MQSITTKYNGQSSSISAKSWNGSCRLNVDSGMSSEENHHAAAQKLVNKLNQNKKVSWAIASSAPLPGDGWVFLIEYVQQVAPLHMSIMVRFMPSTNTRPGHMKTSSWLNPRAKTVYYANLPCGAEIQGNARWAAEQELERINASCREDGDLIGYALDQYVQLPDGDRLFTLKSGDK